MKSFSAMLFSASLLVFTMTGCGDSSQNTPAAKTAPAQSAATSTTTASTTSTTTPASSPKAADGIDALYNKSCVACHATGAAGAPLSHDTAAWSARLEKGMDVLLQNAINGINAMPAKGMCFDCSEEDFKALIEFMTSSK